MANKKISELSATTQANDNVFLVMNNSGNTETFRIKRSDLLSGTSAPSLLAITGNTNSNSGKDFSTIDDVYPAQPNTITEGGAVGYFNLGFNNTINQNGMVVGKDNTTTSVNNEFGNMIIGYDNTLTSDGMIIGRNNTEGRGWTFGRDNTGSGNNYRNVKIGMFNNSSSQEATTIGYYNNNSGNNSFLGGRGNTISSSSYNTILSNFSQITAGQKNSIFGGYDSDITSTNDNNTILNCEGSLISGTTSGTTLIGLMNYTEPTNDNTTYVDKLFSVGQEISSTNDNIIISSSGSITSSGTYNALIASLNSSISSRNRNAIVAGFFGQIQGSGENNFIGGGNSNKILNGYHNTILGGDSNEIEGTSNGSWNSIIGGSTNVVSASTSYSVIVAGNNNIVNHNNSVMLGGSNNTSLYADTAHAENSHTYKTETFDTISGGSVSGVVSVDLSQGTLYKFSITGNITSVDFINWREGQRAEFIVENTGSYTISAMTISGGGSVYVQGGSVNPTNNAFTKYRGVIVDGDMFLNEELNFQPFV